MKTILQAAGALALAALTVLLVFATIRVATVDRRDVGNAVHNIATATYNASTASKSVDTAATHLGALAARIDTASKPVLECVQVDADGKKHGNGACLPSQILATVGAVKAMAGAGAKAAPKFIAIAEKTAGAIGASADNVKTLTSNLSDAGKTVGEQLTVVGDVASGLRSDIQPITVAAADLVNHTDARIGDLMEPIKGTLVAARTSAEGFQNFLPILQTQVIRGTTSVADTADHIAKITKPHWYTTVLGYAVNAAAAYSYVRPVASFTVKASEIISSQK